MSRGGAGAAGHGPYRGPQLPWSLQQQVQGGDSGGAGAARGGSGGRGGGGRGGSSSARDGFAARPGRGRGGGAAGRGPHRANNKPASRKEQRKAARQEKKHHRYEHQQQHAQQRQSAAPRPAQQQQAGAKRPRHAVSAAAPAASAAGAAKRPRREPHAAAAAAAAAAPSSRRPAPAAARAQPPAAAAADTSKTRFYHMLADQGVLMPSSTAAAAAAGAGGGSGVSDKHAAFLADLRMEHEMAKKLGLKKRSKRSGPEDGLDELLSGITELLPADLRKQQRSLAWQAKAAGSGDEDEDEERGASDGSSMGGDSSSGGDGDDGDGPMMSSDGSGDDPWGLGGDSSLSESDLDEDEDSLAGSQEGGGSSDMSSEQPSASDGSLGAAALGSSGEEQSSGGGSSDEGGSGSDRDDGRGSSEDGEPQALAAAAASSGAGRAKAAALVPQAAAAGAAKYVPPALRQAQQAAAGGAAGSALPEAVQRRVTGLLNRLAEANLQAIVREIVGVYETEGRRAVAEAVSAGLLAAVAEGPRATEQFAAVVAVFMAGLAASARAQDISARFLELLAARLEQAYAAGDGLACHNLTMLLAYCYSGGVMAADCMYSVLAEFTRRFTEADVAMMLTLLNAIGLQLRSADPAAMKEFVLAVHARAASAGQAGGMTKRAEIMLELVMDIKNNRLREAKASKAAAAAAAAAKGGNAKAAAAAAGRGGAAALLQPGLLKWLKQSGVDDVTLGNISWAKLVQPDKKGMWWLPAATDAAAGLLPGVLADTPGGAAAMAAAAAAAADADDGPAARGGGAADGGALGAAQLLQLAAGLRMTTDVRRAVFVAIMGSEDCAEACEKLLRLPLKGDQSREVVRVLVECCLQEQRYNPYYGHLAARLAAVSKGYKVTLQYCLWDQWKAVGTTEPRRLLCLAGLVAQLLSSCVLPLSTVKPIDFDAAARWTAKETFLWRHTLHGALAGFASDADCEAALARLASNQALGALCKGLGTFLRLRVGPWVVAQADADALPAGDVEVSLRRLARAEKLLLSSQGAVLAG